MSVVYFDPKGNLTPYLVYRMEAEAFCEAFVTRFETSATRAKLYANYLRYREEFRADLGRDFRQWVGGSFVTRKLNPTDIDLVNIVPRTDVVDGKLNRLVPYMTLGGSKDQYGIDGFFISLEGATGPGVLSHLNHPELDYWQKLLGTDRQGNPKGIIELYVP